MLEYVEVRVKGHAAVTTFAASLRSLQFLEEAGEVPTAERISLGNGTCKRDQGGGDEDTSKLEHGGPWTWETAGPAFAVAPGGGIGESGG